MNSRIEPRVVIAGAGIAGLAAALAFRKAGYEVIVVERASSLRTVGAGILIQANGLLVLDALGLGEAVRAAGVTRRTFDLRDRHGHLLLHTDFNAVLPSHLCPVSIHRAQLHHILWEGCASSGVSLQLGYQVRSVEANAPQPSLICKTIAGEKQISGDLVIGADGIKSIVRDAGGFVTHLEPVIEGSVQGVAFLSISEPLHGEYFGGGEACGMLPIGSTQTFWFWGGSGDAVSAMESTPFLEWKEHVCNNFPVMQRVLDHQYEWLGLVRLLHRSVRCESWSRGNVVLIGDAAHAMSPNLGQGANCALVDALALACHVAVMTSTNDFSKALVRFERDRRSLVEIIQQRGYQEGIVGTQSWPGAELLFKLALRLARFASSARRNAEVRMMSGLDGEGFDLVAAGIRLPVPWQTR
ncbi:MAG: NAD(P)/FAD-dependent oxidoreductase [Acidobacteriota bacterium]